MKIHFLRELGEEEQQILRSALEGEIDFSSGDIPPDQSQTPILVAGRPTFDDLKKFPRLEILIIPWTGLPEETSLVLRDFPDLKVYNLHHNAAPVAELAIGLLLAAAKQIIPYDRSLRRGDWNMRYLNRESILLSGKQALVVGYGEIGKLVKIGLEGLGVAVQVIKKNPGDENSSSIIHPPEKLAELLPKADFLILTLPLTPLTENLIGERELALLPTTAILINVSRGKIVNQAALYQALKERTIFAAGLDVWYNYPADPEARSATPPADFPFHELDNLVLSPHRAGLVRETEYLRLTQTAALINALFRKEQAPNQVDLTAGY